jgi:hypothetical protein
MVKVQAWSAALATDFATTFGFYLVHKTRTFKHCSFLCLLVALRIAALVLFAKFALATLTIIGESIFMCFVPVEGPWRLSSVTSAANFTHTLLTEMK